MLASEPLLGLSEADVCFSTICNDDRMFHRKTKSDLFVAKFQNGALQHARHYLGSLNELSLAKHKFQLYSCLKSAFD